MRIILAAAVLATILMGEMILPEPKQSDEMIEIIADFTGERFWVPGPPKGGAK